MSPELTSAVIGGTFGIVGTMTGALITLKVQARQSKLSTTFSLHQEFHSGELMKARVEADILLRKQWNIKLADIDDRFQDKANCIWVVMNFYSRLYHALKLQRIEIDYVPSMFGEHIVWWWVVHFADRLEGGQWSSYDMMAKLNVWLEAFCRGSRYDGAPEMDRECDKLSTAILSCSFSQI